MIRLAVLFGRTPREMARSITNAELLELIAAGNLGLLWPQQEYR